MEKNNLYEAKEFQNIKELLYYSASKYKNNIAFVTKHKLENNVTYENKTYSDLLKDINALGTKLFSMA